MPHETPERYPEPPDTRRESKKSKFLRWVPLGTFALALAKLVIELVRG
jgi:hypothetical protein